MIFVTSGSEAVESCLKIALQYHSARGEPGRRRFIARQAFGVFRGMAPLGPGPRDLLAAQRPADISHDQLILHGEDVVLARDLSAQHGGIVAEGSLTERLVRAQQVHGRAEGDGGVLEAPANKRTRFALARRWIVGVHLGFGRIGIDDDPGFALRGLDPFLHGRQFHDGVHVSGAHRLQLHAIC